MRKVLSIVIVSVLILGAASPKLRIGYYNQSMFEIVLPSGVRIITDPFEPTSIDLDFPTGVEADIVVMSHIDIDHSYWQGVGGSPDRIYWANGSSHGIDFIAHPTKHSPYGVEGENHIMIWETEGFKFAHMGDYGDVFSAEDSTVLANTTFLFIPVGGAYTITADQANDIIERVRPQVVFPMHYKTPEHTSPIFDYFLTLEEANEFFTFPIVEHDPWIAVDPDNLPQGPVIWEPAYSVDLPGDLEVTAVDATESPPYMIGVNVVNNTPRDADDAALILNVLDGVDVVYVDTTLVSVPGEGDGFHEFGPWMPPESKEYTLFAEVVYPADEIPPNDTLSSLVFLTAVTETPANGYLDLDVIMIDGGVLQIRYSFPGNIAELCIFDVAGKKIDHFDLDANRGSCRYRTGSYLVEGVYFARLNSPAGARSVKFVVIR